MAYGGAVHSFTDWNAGSDNSVVPRTTRRPTAAWAALQDFLRELFGQ